jgi:hypothetical protein
MSELARYSIVQRVAQVIVANVGATNRLPCDPGVSVGLESKPQHRPIDPAFTIFDGAVCDIATEPPGSRTTNATKRGRLVTRAASRRRPGIHG